jgi:hypothetical protein
LILCSIAYGFQNFPYIHLLPCVRLACLYLALTTEIEVTPMAKGNNAQSKEKKKPKKAAAPKAIPVKSSTPPPKKP